MKLRDFRRGHLIRGPFSKLRHKVVVQHRCITGGGLRLPLRFRMLVDEKFDELREQHRRIRLRLLLCRVPSSGDRAENRLGPGAYLFRSEYSVTSQRHEASRTSPSHTSRSVAENIRLGPALRHPKGNPFNSVSQTT